MGLQVIRICDECGAKHEQIITVHETEFVCPITFTCSNCIIRLAQADELDALQAEQNEGRGVCCVRSIVSCLRKHDGPCAKRVYQSEGDKIYQYPELQKWFEKHFGCRTHLKKDCDDWLCRKIQ